MGQARVLACLGGLQSKCVDLQTFQSTTAYTRLRFCPPLMLLRWTSSQMLSGMTRFRPSAEAFGMATTSGALQLSIICEKFEPSNLGRRQIRSFYVAGIALDD